MNDSATEPAAPPPAVAASLRPFLWLSAGQIVSILGSRLTSFALGVWIFQQTGSTTSFAMMLLASSIPGILMQPLAGVLVDRWDRRHAMMLGDSGSAAGTLVLAVLLASGNIALWQIYVVLAVMGVFDAIQSPAYEAAVPLLVAKEHLGRASGLIDLGSAGTRILAPTLAGALIGVLGLAGLLVLDFVTFLLALVSLLLIRMPLVPPPTTEGAAAEEKKKSPWHQILFGWNYLRQRRGLFSLLLVSSVTNFALAMVVVLFTPLVLSFATALELGFVMSAAAAGGLFGGLLMLLWGGPKKRVHGILAFAFLQGAILLLGGLRPNVPLVSAAAFFFMLWAPVIGGSSRALWQTKVALDVQGRVFAFRNVIALIMSPAAFLAAGPLADQVFEPLLLEGGPLSGSVGLWLGSGPGRGIGLLLIVLGLLIMATMVLGALFGPLRRLEDELPDALH